MPLSLSYPLPASRHTSYTARANMDRLRPIPSIACNTTTHPSKSSCPLPSTTRCMRKTALLTHPHAHGSRPVLSAHCNPSQHRDTHAVQVATCSVPCESPGACLELAVAAGLALLCTLACDRPTSSRCAPTSQIDCASVSTCQSRHQRRKRFGGSTCPRAPLEPVCQALFGVAPRGAPQPRTGPSFEQATVPVMAIHGSAGS